MAKKLSIVIPVFNESLCIDELWARVSGIANQLTYEVEIIVVDDGSTDTSFAQISAIAQADSRLKIIRFSRNFGHQLAITAGMDLATGDAVILIDADLQDPPELIVEMLAQFEQGADVVYAVRRRREGETGFKRWSAAMFYKVMRQMSPISIPLDTGDFRLMSRRVVDALNTMREKDRFVRGMVSWVGFDQRPVYFDRDPRWAGETKYPLRKMIKFALNGLTSFSTVPLRWATWLGFVFALGAGLYIMIVVGLRLTGHTFPGYASLMIAILLLGGIQLMTVGIVGDYVGRLYLESKRRPLYVIRDRVGFD